MLRRHASEALRLVLLQLLEEAGYSVNDRILLAAAREMGHAASADTLRVELAWLAEQGLVTTRAVGPFTVATLSSRGAEVARGEAAVPGVSRPEPDAAP